MNSWLEQLGGAPPRQEGEEGLITETLGENIEKCVKESLRENEKLGEVDLWERVKKASKESGKRWWVWSLLKEWLGVDREYLESEDPERSEKDSRTAYEPYYTAKQRLEELSRRVEAWMKKLKIPQIPNECKFEITESPIDILSSIFGIATRQGKSTITTIKGPNTRANRFIRYMFRRLVWAIELKDYKTFWKIAWLLVRSASYQKALLHRVLPTASSTEAIGVVEGVLGKVKEIAEGVSTELDFKRTYIPKQNGKYRPLGVPTLPWRVYLGMWVSIMAIMRQMSVGGYQEQHGYTVGRSIVTAWQGIIARLDSETIIEFDLKGFFDRVNLQFISKCLQTEYGMGPEDAEMWLKINRSLVKLEKDPKKDKIEETDRKVLLNSNGTKNHQNPEIPEELTAEEILLRHGEKAYKQEGVPQGAATSTFLSIMALCRKFKQLGRKLLMYADDGLIFLGKVKIGIKGPKSPSEYMNDPEAGLTVSEEKSSYVKLNGKWLKPLKFLGIVFTPSELTEDGISTLESSTRGGKKIKVTREEELLIHLKNLESGGGKEPESGTSYQRAIKGGTVEEWVREQLEKWKPHKESVLQVLKNEKTAGKLISYLFSGTWEGVQGKSELTIVRGSWAYFKAGKVQYYWIRNYWERMLLELIIYYGKRIEKLEELEEKLLSRKEKGGFSSEGEFEQIHQPIVKEIERLEKHHKKLHDLKERCVKEVDFDNSEEDRNELRECYREKGVKGKTVKELKLERSKSLVKELVIELQREYRYTRQTISTWFYGDLSSKWTKDWKEKTGFEIDRPSTSLPKDWGKYKNKFQIPEVEVKVSKGIQKELKKMQKGSGWGKISSKVRARG
jgi:hypothetical protein